MDNSLIINTVTICEKIRFVNFDFMVTLTCIFHPITGKSSTTNC